MSGAERRIHHRLRVVAGERCLAGGDRAGGLAFAVTQTASQDISTC